MPARGSNGDLGSRSALAIISIGGQESDHSSRAPQALEDDVEEDLPLLAGLGWPLRSLAGIVWAASGVLDLEIGSRLAVDVDPRVRCALPGALAGRPADEQAAHAREILASEPRYSVCRTLGGTDIDD